MPKEGVVSASGMVGVLLACAQDGAPDQLTDAVMAAASEIGGSSVAVYLIDYGQGRLRALAPCGEASLQQEASVQDSLPGTCFRTLEPVIERAGGSVQCAVGRERLVRCWLPILAGAERLGVLGVTFEDPAPCLDETVAQCAQLGRLLGLVLVAQGAYADTYQRVARRQEMSLAAEMQWQILPPLTASTDRVVVSGILEPCYEVGGDTFDYAITRDCVHLAVFDAVGHGLSSSLLATAAVGAYRHARRGGVTLVETAQSIDSALEAQFGPERFVAGLFLELDLVHGHLHWLNAGQPAPLLLRDGKVFKQLISAPRPPLGVLAGVGGRVGEVGYEVLERGDRVLVFTDGLVEARSPDGELFGLDRLIALVTAKAQGPGPASETMRSINQAILAHQDGVVHDDATQVQVEWRRGAP